MTKHFQFNNIDFQQKVLEILVHWDKSSAQADGKNERGF
jgi:hypothetical protein